MDEDTIGTSADEGEAEAATRPDDDTEGHNLGMVMAVNEIMNTPRQPAAPRQRSKEGASRGLRLPHLHLPGRKRDR